MILRKLLGTVHLRRFDKNGNPEPHAFEVWADAELVAKAMGARALKSKDRHATALLGAVLVKEVK
jgi:hypothetical protein